MSALTSRYRWPRPRLPEDPDQRSARIEAVRATVEEWQAYTRKGDEAYAEGNRAISVVHEAEAAIERLASGRVEPDQLPDVRRTAAQYEEAVAQRRRGSVLRRQYEDRRYALEVDRHDDLALWAESYTEKVLEAAEALLPVLVAYLDAYDQAVACWGAFRRARVRVMKNEYPDSSASRMNDLAHCPTCPIDREVMEALVTVLPRPVVYRES
jgi:hypothetical protein